MIDRDQKWCCMAFAIIFLVYRAECQILAPVDISGFGKGRPIQAVISEVSSSECRGSSDIKAGVLANDDLSHDINLSITITFKNRSSRPVMFYKKFNPALTERIGESLIAIAQRRFVAGYDGDRMTVSKQPLTPTSNDFIVLKPAESYAVKSQVAIYASTDPKNQLRTPGRYWVQLGIDMRPDDFYVSERAKREFEKKWQPRARLVEFVLADPFPVDIALDPKAAKCQE